MYHIYVLYCPLTRRIRYIGKTKNPEKRLREHVTTAFSFPFKMHPAKAARHEWVRGLIRSGLSPRMRVIASSKNKEVIDRLELELIKKYADRDGMLNAKLF